MVRKTSFWVEKKRTYDRFTDESNRLQGSNAKVGVGLTHKAEKEFHELRPLAIREFYSGDRGHQLSGDRADLFRGGSESEERIMLDLRSCVWGYSQPTIAVLFASSAFLMGPE